MALREYVERIERFLEDHRVEDYHFEHRAKHLQIKGTSKGKAFCVTFPKTGSDHRGSLNTVSQLRHALGLVGAKAGIDSHSECVKRTKRHKRAAQVTCQPHKSEPVVRVDRYYAPLEIIRERLVANANAVGIPGPNAVVKPAAPQVTRLLTPWLGKRVRFAAI
jgi:hypothetical protein